MVKTFNVLAILSLKAFKYIYANNQIILTNITIRARIPTKISEFVI